MNNNTNHMPPVPMTLSSSFLNDHLCRLYDVDTIDPTTFRHIDQPDSVIVVTSWKGNTAKATLTMSAVQELADDADYQWEFSEGAYRSMARRVRDKATAVMA